MDSQSAATILSRLADGVDPATGEVFPRESPYQRPETVRALFAAISALRDTDKRKGATARFARSGQPWSPDEEQRLLRAYESGKTPKSLTSDFGRSEVAITARLVKLGQMEAPPNLRFNERPTSAGSHANGG